MNRKIYPQRMSFSRYDATHCLVYLNELLVDNYVPDDAPEGFKPTMGYSYEGPEADGGTMIEARDDSRDALVNGIIRSHYSQTEEDAIKTHQIMLLKAPDCEKAEDYAKEWETFCAIRNIAIQTVDVWLS